MNCEINIHKGYVEFELAKEEGHKIPEMFGKYQFVFSSDKGKISMIQLKNYMSPGDTQWEIYSLEGDLFDDVERFAKRQDAEERARFYLE